MAKKAPFWIYVEELAEKMRAKGKSLSFAEIKKIADRDWPCVPDEERERYKMLSRQDRMDRKAIRYEPPATKQKHNTTEVSDYSQVLSKSFLLVDTPLETTLQRGGELGLASFSLIGGVSQFLSAHLLPRTAPPAEPVRRLLQLPIIQKSSIVVSSNSEILTRISQLCGGGQYSTRRILLFAKRPKVHLLQKLFSEMLAEQAESHINISVHPMEELIGCIQTALSHQIDVLDITELTRVSHEISRRCLGHGRVPCSRHRATDMACAHGTVSALVFSFIEAFKKDLKPLGVDINSGSHCMRFESIANQPNGTSGRELENDRPLPETTASDSATVVPGPMVFIQGKGRLRTIAKVVRCKDSEIICGNGESREPV